MKNVAIIPARSGSKGLVHKNIKTLCGKPLIAHTIEAALKSGLFEEVMVSTDSPEYAEIAKEFGAQVPFLRSSDLANDQASSWDVVREVIEYYESNGKTFDSVCLLQPTSPLRTDQNIHEAYELFEQKNAVTVVSVCEMDHSPLWANTLPDDFSMKQFLRPEVLDKNRQGLETFYRINGALYIVQVDHLKNHANIYGEGSFAYVMDKKDSIDIDDMDDFLVAETYMKLREPLSD